MRVKVSGSLFWTALAVRLAPVFVAALVGFFVVALDALSSAVEVEAPPSACDQAISVASCASDFEGASGGPETARRRAKAPSEVRG